MQLSNANTVSSISITYVMNNIQWLMFHSGPDEDTNRTPTEVSTQAVNLDLAPDPPTTPPAPSAPPEDTPTDVTAAPPSYTIAMASDPTSNDDPPSYDDALNLSGAKQGANNTMPVSSKSLFWWSTLLYECSDIITSSFYNLVHYPLTNTYALK